MDYYYCIVLFQEIIRKSMEIKSMQQSVIQRIILFLNNMKTFYVHRINKSAEVNDIARQ